MGGFAPHFSEPRACEGGKSLKLTPKLRAFRRLLRGGASLGSCCRTRDKLVAVVRGSGSWESGDVNFRRFSGRIPKRQLNVSENRLVFASDPAAALHIGSPPC